MLTPSDINIDKWLNAPSPPVKIQLMFLLKYARYFNQWEQRFLEKMKRVTVISKRQEHIIDGMYICLYYELLLIGIDISK